MPSNKKRKYVAKEYNSVPLFIVYQQDNESLTSDGPFVDIKEAEDTMHSLLIKGICAWMVSYNEKEG
tara:strand:- start:3339 stop:3539 length:201 start_codon:yes stop_codon:yes gene_type:complete